MKNSSLFYYADHLETFDYKIVTLIIDGVSQKHAQL